MADISVNLTIEDGITVNVGVGTATAGVTMPTVTAENDFMIGSAALAWVTKTLAQVKTILGLGTAAYTDATAYATAVHTQSITTIISAAFQTPAFANPLALDATTYKNFKPGLITGNTTVNLTGCVDGDAGQINLIIDAVGGYIVALGAMFTKKYGSTSIVATANADNLISWSKVGTDISYTIIQKV